MGNRTFIHKNSLTSFHDGLAWLMQIVMFVTLGLLVYPSRLTTVAWTGMAVALFLMLVARPVGVHLTLAMAPLPFREKVMTAWVGLRGSVPIVLATYPLLAGVPNADTIFHLVFFVVLMSVLVQGPSLPYVARWLGVDEPVPPTLRTAPLLPSVGSLAASLVEIPVPKESPVVGKPIVDLGVPPGVYIALVQRGDELVVPGGGTKLAAGDTLLMAGNVPAMEQVRRMVEGNSK